MNCPRCNSPATEETLREFGGVCPKCLLQFSEEKDAPAFPSLEIVEMIGQGGMGVVYKAVQKSLGRTVALKVLSPQLSTDPEFVERFTREARALAQLNHPNIVGIYDSGIHDRVPYLVMEYVDGKSLRQLLAAKDLTASQVLEFVPQICDALYYGHARGVVHRDINPENILIDAAGRVKIADYGLAKIASLDQPQITKSNVAMGTPHYMAPEQIERTGEVDHRADIYSLGVVFYEMLTGELPLGRFKAPSERAETDRRLDRVVLKSLEREPADRYQSANEVKSQITHLDKGAPPAAASGGPRLSKLAVTSGILCLHGLAFLTLAIILMAIDRVTAANVFAVLGGVLLLASIGFSMVAGLLILGSRGALRGLWIPIASGLSSGLLLLIGIGGTMVIPARAPEAPARVTVVPPPSAASQPTGTAFHLAEAWPRPEDLPAGLAYESVVEGAEAFPPVPKETTNPDGSVTLRSGAQYRDMLPDLVLGRMATLADGGIRLIGLEFKTEFARRRWQRECRIYPVLVPERGNPDGRSLFILGRTGLQETPAASAAIDVLIPLLQKKMATAAAAYRE